MANLPKARRHHESDSAGRTATPEYRAWQGMITRCTNPNRQNYKFYGGRGITVAAVWRTDFRQFLSDVGRRPSLMHRLERKDNQRGYEPGNVCWATPQAQARNTRRNRLLTAHGETLPLCVWAERLAVDHMVITGRLRSGWSVDRAVTVPARRKRAV